MAEKNKDNNRLYVIGVGASAGGLDAITKFLGQVNGTKIELCIVVVMHLSPDHKSELAAILDKRCKWPVVTVENNVQLEPFYVYVAPPKHQLIIQNDRLCLDSASDEYPSSPSIDHFFSSLAAAKKKNAVGVILSGFGSDGSQGILDIKKNNGLTMVQLPDTSEQRSMPDAAIETASVDVVIPAEQMFDEIVQYANNSLVIATTENKKNAVDAIFDLLAKRSGTNFSMYKPSTIMRRITIRINALRLSTIMEYYELIKINPRELDILFDTVLIGVTEFFRNEEAFEQLGKQLEEVIKEKEIGDSLRIWSVGCATGEEPYSLAILLSEMLGNNIKNYHIQIFASDVDEKAINYARKGIYHQDSLSNLPEKMINTYFERSDEVHYEVNKDIKQHILFTRHDITNDPPFVKLDLIVCRNLLIYFNNVLQKQSFQVFHYSLRSKGILFLGKSESVSVVPSLFTKLNKFKMYRKSDTSLGYQLRFSRYQNRFVKKDTDQHGSKARGMTVTDVAKETLFHKFEHPMVIVDENSDIKEVQGSLRLYMEMGQGAVNFNLAKMVNPELVTAIKALHAQVKKTSVAHSSHILKFKLYDQMHFVRIKMIPLVYRIDETQYYMVIFEKVEPGMEHLALYDKLETTDYENIRIRELEEELASTKEHLQIFTEELEATNEELQTINEELQSANEELKSSNEELETSNEELQSANEELNTANQELRLTNELLIEKEKELKEEKNISEKNELIYRTIAESIPNATIGILNDNFEIEFIAGQGLTDLLPEDLIGRNMPAINPSKREAERLRKMCISSLEGNVEQIEVNYKDRHYEVRSQLFNYPFTDGKKIFYLVREITEAKRNQRILETALDAADLIVSEYDFEEEQFLKNKRLAALLEYNQNKKISEVDLIAKIHPEDLKKHKKSLEKSFKTGLIDQEMRLKLSNGIKHLRVKGRVIFDDNKNPLKAVVCIMDITYDKNLLFRIQENEQRFQNIADSAPMTIWMSDSNKGSTYVNKNWLHYTGSTLEENEGSGFLKFVHSEDVDNVVETYEKAFDQREIFIINYRAKKHDGTYRWFLNKGVPMVDSDDNFTGYIGVNLDITDQLEFTSTLEVKVEERTKELSNANERLMKLNLNLEEFAYMASHDLKEPLRKIRTFNSLLGKENQDPSEINTYVNKIEESAERMTDLIDSILDYSRIEENLERYENVNLDQVLNEVTSDLTVLIQNENVEITSEDLGEVVGIPIRVYQLFSNLIKNAVKFNRNVPKVNINVSVVKSDALPDRLGNSKKQQKFKKISFTDNGIGIEPSKRDYIFKPFKRLNSNSDFPGTGIGLSICRKIMELHGGYIDLEEIKKGGSCFTLYFPL